MTGSLTPGHIAGLQYDWVSQQWRLTLQVDLAMLQVALYLK